MFDDAPSRLSPLCSAVAVAAGMLALGAFERPLIAGIDEPPTSAPEAAQAETPPPAPAAEAAAPQAAPAPPAPRAAAEDLRLRFSFKGQTYDEILDWFSRMTGYPVVRETAVPAGTVDYIYPGEYTLPEALRTLNILLQTQGVMLRVEGERLFLQKVDDMKRENVPTFVGALPEEVTDDQIVTVLVPLLNAQAKPVAEQLKNLVAAYGSVTALEQQNALIIVETAAQVRRLQRMLGEIDQQDVENIIEFIPIRNAKADEMLKSLNALMGERVVEFVIDARDGKRTKIEENRLAGLVLTADTRTNAIIARGTRNKIEQVKETIALLDVPVDERGFALGTGGARQVRTIRTVPLERQSVAAARGKLDALFAALPAERRPAILPMEETGRIAIVGDPAAVAEGEQVLRELEGLDDDAAPRRETRFLALARADAAAIAPLLEAILPDALAAAGDAGGEAPSVRVVPGVNAILAVGSPRQQEILRLMVGALDVERQVAVPLRILQLRASDAGQLADAINRTYAARPAQERGAKPVNVSADPATNTLLVAAHPDAFAEIRELVEDLNDAGQMPRSSADDREIRIFPLKIAQAAELARTLDEMFPPPPPPLDVRGRPMPQLAQLREVVVRAEPQTNSLIVDATSARLVGFEELVRQLDREQLASDVEIRTYRLPKSRLDSIAQTIRQLASQNQLGVPQGRGAVVVSIEPVAGTLVVSGPTEIFARVDALVDELGGSDLPTTVLRTYRLEKAKAESVAPMLRQVLAGRIRQLSAEASGDAATQLERLLEVVPDRRSNALILQVPESLLPLADELVRQLDQGHAAGEPTVRVRPLTFADANAVAASLSQILPTVVSKATGEPIEMRVVPAGGANAIFLVGLPADLDEVDALIEPLDARPASDAVDAKTYQLSFAQAATVAPVLERLLNDQQETDPRVILERIRLSRGQVDRTPRVRVEADIRTNAIIVSGPQRTVALAETLVAQLDRADAAAERVFAIYTPQEAVPERLVESARRVLEATKPADARTPIELIAEPQSGAIVVVATPTETERAMEVLKRFDAAAARPPQLDLAVLALEHRDAASVAAAVQPILSDRSRWPTSLLNAAKAGLPIGEPRVTADPAGGRVLVVAPKELIAIAEELVQRLDRPREDEAAADVRVYTLVNAEATEVARALQSSVDARAAQRPGRAKPIVTAETSSNAVVVTAAPDELDLLDEVVAKLDSGTRADAVQVRTVFLRHARAEQVAPLVEKLLAPAPAPPQVPGRPRLPAPAPEPPVRVAADSRLNAVVVSAAPATLHVAEQMVVQLDQAPGADRRREVRVLVVEHADAAELARDLDELFREAATSEGGAVALPPTIRVNAGGNALIVRASDEQFAQIDSVVRSLERATVATSRQLRTVPIDPAKGDAAEIARLLERMLRQGEGSAVEVVPVEELLRRYGPSGGAPRSMLESLRPFGTLAEAIALLAFAAQEERAVADGPSVTVAVDERTNSLVLLGSPKAIERAQRLIEEAQRQLPVEASVVRTVPMSEGMDPERIRGLVVATLERMTAGAGQTPIARRVAVLADTEARALVVVANDRDFPIVGQLIATFATAATPDRLTIRSYPLANVSADRAAAGLRELLQAGVAGGGRREGRFRDLAVAIEADGARVEANFDPSRVRALPDASTNALVVVAPSEALPFLDRFVELADQAPPTARAAVRLFPLRHARAEALRATVGNVFAARARSTGAGVQPEFAVDARTNTLLVTAGAETLREIESLVAKLDEPTERDRRPLVVLDLASAEPVAAASLLERVVVGDDQARRESTLILPDAASGTILVRADDATLAEMRGVLAEIDRSATSDFPVRSILLERADASSVAEALQRFYDDRARVAAGGRQRRDATRRVSIVGDSRSATLLVSANEETFREIEGLVAQFDSEKATQAVEFRVYPLVHAKAQDIATTVQSLLEQLVWGDPSRWSMPRSRENRTSMAVRADNRLNALVVTGRGDAFALVDQVVEQLDQPVKEGLRLAVRAYSVRGADLESIAGLLRDALGVTQWRMWGESGPRVRIVSVPASRSLVVSANEEQHAEIASLLASFDRSVASEELSTQVLPVEFAQAGEIAETLRRFLEDRRDGAAGPAPTIMSSGSVNALVVSASAADLATIRDLLDKLDQPNSAGERSVSIIALTRGQAIEVARMISEQFRGRGGGAQGVIVTADARTNSLVVNAPPAQLAQVQALVERLDGPSGGAETIIRTYPLRSAKADEVVRILGQTLQLDARGRTPGATGISVKLDETSEPVEVVARVAADRRSNSVIVTATVESFPVIEALLQRLEEVPAASPVEYRVLPLEHAIAFDVAATLQRLVRQRQGGEARDEVPPSIDSNRFENSLVIAATADQFRTIEEIVRVLDVPSSRPRTTDFIALRFAQAEKVQDALTYFYGSWAPEADTPDKMNVRIVADTASNSLVISAAESEWEGIRALLAKLDSEEYAAGVQLRVMPLMHADARSVANAINEAFRGPAQQRRDAARAEQQQGDRRDAPPVPTTLVRDEDWVSAAAEQGTNSIVVSASRANLERIESIVKQLDVADFDRLPAPRLIPVRFGNPEELARAIDRIYAPPAEAGRGEQRSRLRIVADQSSNALIVRAGEEEFRQIAAIAEALQQQADAQGLNVHVLPLASASASRVAAAIREAFTTRAEQAKLPFSVQVDPVSNALVVASTGPLFEEVKRVVERMDAMAPGANQAIFIIDLAHVEPEAAKTIIEQIGLDKPVSDGSTSRVVVEPVKVSVVPGRAALVVVGNPADRETIVAFLKAIDAEPPLPESVVRLLPLRTARADALARVLGEMLQPGAAPAARGLSRALQEQIRRLAVRRDGAGQEDLKLDLTKPVKVVADSGMNALIVSSTADNVRAIEEFVRMLDTLPVTEAVTVQIFPLENIAVEQFARIVGELFEQGKALGRAPGSDVEGLPQGTAGKALLSELAVSIDERTNTIVVAGPEEAVAFVEVLRTRLDKEVGIGWIEPQIIPLRFADAEDLAATLQAVLVEGSRDLPEATPLQKQVGRLRMARMGENGGQVIEGDVFVPMSQLVVRAESQLRALVVVGSRSNVELVRELVRQLDVEAASPAALVRVYPVENASASRLAPLVTQLFEQQRQARTIRDEDRLRAVADERTNTLIVSTSPRSFVVFEELLKTLDRAIAPDIKEIRTYPLRNASASRLAPLIQQLMDARLERLRKIQPETADLERASIVADARTNALVVAAGADSFAVVERLAADLDREEGSEAGLLQVLSVRKANIDRVASALNQIMERRYADTPEEVRRRIRPLVLTDPRTSSLLVSASPEDLKAIEDLVAKLEAAPENPAIGVEVIALDAARAEELAPRIQTLMRDRLQSLGLQQQPSDAVSVVPDVVSNSLVVAASPENVAVVRNLIEVLTKAAAEAIGGQGFEIVQLAKSRAADIVAMLDELYVREENRRRGANTVKAAAEPRLNSVVLAGSEPDLAAMRRMVAQLDGARPSSVVEIKYIPLASANVIETVNLIQTVLSGASIAGGPAGQQAIVLKYLREIGGAEGPSEGPIEMEVSAAVRQSISLTPDIRTNTVIVRAPRESMELIERMVRDLDGSNQGSQNIRIFRLVNADAEQMSGILRELFNLERRGNLYVLKPREELGIAAPGGDAAAAAPVANAPTGVGLFGSDLTLVPDERQQLAITVDNRTNSLIVSGSRTYLELVEKVVLELDEQEANTRDTFVYQLKNATALDVARVLTDFVQQDQQKVLATLSADQRPSAQKLLDQEVTIVGDEKSNTVLINASPRYMDRVRAVIAELDVDPPQVLIQVLLAEVTLDTSEDLGLQFTRFSIGDTSVAGGFGLNRGAFGNGQPQAPGLIGLAPALFGGVNVPNIAIGNADFDLLLNALQAQNRVELLSNPSVMVANNTEGFIQVGDTVRLPNSISFNSVGQQSSVEPEDVGVILRVTPSINPEGFVRMRIEPEISRISKDTTAISEDFQSPVINRRRANTTVTVKDGQTVVIGGLIQDRFERIDRKVPFFGDIPLIGPLFRNKSESTSKTELLIVLTPHVVSSQEEIDAFSRRMIGKTSIERELRDQIERGELEGMPGGVPGADGSATGGRKR